MSRLILLLALVPQLAFADEAVEAHAESADALPDQSLGAMIGIAGGGRTTPGGLRVTGHYLYQLSAQDWFDGTASFTFGGGGAACFRDRMDALICDHDLADGRAFEGVAAVRRYFAAQGQFRPYARLGVGLAVVRFGGDDVTGVAIPLHVGGGLRANLAPQVALVAQVELIAGLARFGRVGTEPQFGIAVTAGAEFRLP